MNITTRQVMGDELLDTLYGLEMYALHPSPPFQLKEEWAAVIRERKGVTCHAVFEDGVPVSIALSTAMTQNMRGKLFTASGIWGVSTSPAARRKGYCKQAMASLLAAERETGKVFSNLYPFRESFYERLGYITFPLAKKAIFSTSSLSSLLSMSLEGEVILKPIGEAYSAYREYLAELRMHRHGMAFFDHGDDKLVANRNAVWAALAMVKGKIEGFMLYRIQGEEISKYHFNASRFYYSTSRARYLLLNWIARHIDQTECVELRLTPDEYPETWLADLQVKIEAPSLAAMNRVLDVAELSGMNTGEGSFTAQITDPLCPWNEGVWRFNSSDGKLQLTRASHADCQLTIQGLSALVAGGHAVQDIPIRSWGNPDSTQQATLTSMFPHSSPYLHEIF
jgi:predicted acetyltransferase